MATRLQLRTNARTRADQDSSDFPTDDQYNMFLDKAAGRIWRQLVRLGWKPETATVSITATGASGYAFENTQVGDRNAIRVLYVHRVDGTNRYPLQRLKEEERAILTDQTGDATRYDFTGGGTANQRVELFPSPNSGTYEVRYVKTWGGFTTDTTEWLGPDGTDELIELDAAIQGVLKENGDASDLRAQLSAVWDEVVQAADWIDGNHPGTIRDVNHSQGYDPFGWNIDTNWI